MTYIGIDPGKKGGIAVIEEKGAYALPYSGEALIEVCKRYEDEERLCFVEKVNSMPGQGVASTFSFGTSYGYILGVLECTETPYDTVSPRKWKNHYGLDNDKQRSIEKAQRLFPQVKLRANDRCRVDNDGMAEALLIALYAKRTDGAGGGK